MFKEWFLRRFVCVLLVMVCLVQIVSPVFAQPVPLCREKLMFALSNAAIEGVAGGWMVPIYNTAGDELVGYALKITDDLQAGRLADSLDFVLETPLDDYLRTQSGMQSILRSWDAHPLSPSADAELIADEFEPCDDQGPHGPDVLEDIGYVKKPIYNRLPLAAIVVGTIALGLYLLSRSKNNSGDDDTASSMPI